MCSDAFGIMVVMQVVHFKSVVAARFYRMPGEVLLYFELFSNKLNTCSAVKGMNARAVASGTKAP